MIEINVPEELENFRLDICLTRLCDLVTSRSMASKLIEGRWVFVDGKSVKSSYKVKMNQKISMDEFVLAPPEASPQGEPIPLHILFEDEHLIVLNKAAGMVVHPGAGVFSGTLVNAILAHCGSTLPSLGHPSRAGIVHRLDRDTSGVMVVAKSQKALTGLSQQFADHSQHRLYHAIVYGCPFPQEARLETWHGRDPKNRFLYAPQVEGVGKKAILNYRMLKASAHRLCSLVECQLYTGRTHQIRVQMKSIGHGLLGDALYAPLPQQIKQNPVLQGWIHKNIDRQMLHAKVLGFKHPATGEYQEYSCEYPPDMDLAMSFLFPEKGEVSSCF